MKAVFPNHKPVDGVAETILKALRGLHYGSVEIVVHDSKVVRIERHERIRLETDREERPAADR